MTMSRVSILTLCAVVSAAHCYAQSTTGTILGVVKDASGAVVSGAKVVVTNTGTNLRFETPTSADGSYTAPLLPIGAYMLEVSAPGFRTYRQEGIRLQVNQQARVDVSLALGQLNETVEVRADAAVVETTTSSVGKVVDNKRIRELPLNTRNVYALIYLTPGVSGGIGNSHNQIGYSVNGVRGGLMDTLVDGASAAFPTVNGFHGISVFPSVDAVEEFKVQAQNYSAEFGRSLGSVLNLVYKSGTNEFHGSAYNFLRNSKLDANNFFNNGRGIRLGSFKRNQFGGVFSGPIKKDKTFFMTSFEALRQRSFSETLATVPTALERRGDFTQTAAGAGRPIIIYDPLTTRPNPAGAGSIRTAFPGNVIPADRFDPVSRNIVRYWPEPNQPGIPGTNQNNFYNSGSARVNTDNFDVRIDHNITSKQRIFGRFSHRRSFDGPPQLFPGELGIAEGRINLNDWGKNAVIDYANTISSTTIWTTRLGFARNKFLYENNGLGFLPSSLGLPRDIDVTADRAMFPAISVGGQRSLGGGDHRQSGFNSWSLLSNIARVSGRHSLKVGYEGRLLLINVWEARNAGAFSFNAGFTQGPNPNAASATAGYGFASFLLGTGSSGNLLQGWKNVASASTYHGFYIQDDWRVTNKLTLNLGLRYDFDVPRTERYNRMNWFDPSVPSPLNNTPGFSNLTGGVHFVGVNGNPRRQFDGDYNNAAPRAGLAYQWTPKTVIRAGFGQLFGPSTMAAQGTVGPYGFRNDYVWVTSLDNGLTPQNYLRNPFPSGFRPLPGASDGLLTAVGGTLEAPLRNQVVPYTLQWNFTIQRELPGQILFEVGYIGNGGRQQSRGGEGGFTLNQIPAQYLSLGSQLNQQVPNPFFGRGLGGVLANQTVARSQLLRPYPQFGELHPLFSNGGNTSYHALQMTFSKRYSQGITFEGNYTWAKAIAHDESHMDSYNLALSRSVTTNHIPHRLVFSGVYELPFGKGRRFGSGMTRLADSLVGGWQVNGIVTIQSGAPLQIGATNTIGLFTKAARANNNGTSGAKSGNVRSRMNGYFDQSVFSQPAPFTFGTLGTRVPDILGHYANNLDFSLFKQFAVTEKTRLQFRAEAFNAFNRVQFGGINTTVTSGSFGFVTSQANTPRQMQFGLKLLF
jgi:outer membrane receptor protein involved in Fe transport